MINKLLLCSLLLALATGLAMGQATTSEAFGTIVDQDGQPLAGVQVQYYPQNNPKMVYKGQTNKKGKYFVSGLYSPHGESWLIELKLEGYVPVKMRLESRTVNRVLLGEPRTVSLKPHAAIPEVPIKPLGQAQVDFTMIPREQAEQLARQASPDAAQAAPQAQAQAQADPWDEALRLAAGPDKASAVPLFEKAVADKPDDAERREVFAKVLYQLERYDVAEEQARKAVELAPQEIEGYLVLFTTYVHQDDLVRAKETLDQAEQIDPTNLQLLERRAYLAGRSGDSAAEIAAYGKLVELDPTNKDAWVSLGGLYAAAGDLKRSEEAYRRVVEIDPAGAHQVFFNLGALSLKNPGRSAADTDKAVHAFRKAIEIKPDYARAHRELALALLGSGDRAGALASLQRYVELAPDASDATQMQGLIDTLKK